ncbi:MAG TPA: glycosyltransferase family 87 protein [Terriglobales bacterium]|nr:glycosyltransferase family 87 protein [Terriglobales bacterium]
MTAPSHFRLRLWLILSVLSAFSMWYYVANVWSVGQPAQFSDLYARWWGAHELLLHHRDPYSPAVTREIQIVIYGAPVGTSHPGDAAELAGGFAYPIYVVFLMWPTVLLAFPVVQDLFLCLFVALTLMSLSLWLYALRWRLSAAELGILAVFTFGSFPVLQGLRLQNLSLLVAFLVAATLASLAADYFTVAGLLLASTTIKPQFVILLIPWLALWIMGDWRRRQRMAWSFSATMSALILGSEVLDPGWISRFLTVVRAYRQYTYGHSLLDVWFTPRIGSVVAVVLVLVVLALCWRCRSYPAQSSLFFLACSLVLAATLVVIPTLEPHAQLLLLPGFLFLVRHGRGIWRSGKIARLFLTAAWVLLGWAWVAAFGMLVTAIWLPAGTLLRFWALPLYTSPLLPFGILIVLGFLLGNETKFFPTRGMILEA